MHSSRLLFSHAFFFIIIKLMKKNYMSPESEVMVLNTQGVICTSETVTNGIAVGDITYDNPEQNW